MARDPELIPLDPETIRRAREILFYDLCGELRDVSEAYLDLVTYDVLEAASEDIGAYVGQLLKALREARQEADACKRRTRICASCTDTGQCRVYLIPVPRRRHE